MGDPLSVAASAAGLVSIGLTVCSGLLDYYSVWKDQPSDVSAMCESLVALNKTFGLLHERVCHPLVDRKSVDLVTESIISCAAGVQRLRSKLDKIRKAKPGTLFRRDEWLFDKRWDSFPIAVLSDSSEHLALSHAMGIFLYYAR